MTPLEPSPRRIAVLASGRGSNLGALLAAEERGSLGASVALVISDRRDAPALQRARAAGKPAHWIDPGPSRARLCREAQDAILELLERGEIGVVALAGFMRIVGPRLIARFPQRLLNIHPSLLPAFPGLDAQAQAWEYGVRYAGCTAHLVNEKIDAGPVILQSVVSVLPNDTPESLAERILVQEHVIYPKAVRLVAEGRITVNRRRVVIDDEGADWL